MADYDNNNRGALFKNEKENERQPDFRGPINVDGKDYQLSAWVRTSDKAGKYFSIAVSENKPRSEAKATASTSSEDIPF